MPGTLVVSLNRTRVGTISNIPGDYNIFAFDPAYVENSDRPLLSQSFIDKNENLLRVIPRTHTASPAFFSNLLPERGSALRRIVARQRRIKKVAPDFPYLQALGHDLPGAVVIEGSITDDPTWLDEDNETGTASIRFSLAGMQLKFSAGMANERFSIDERGAGGTWIVKMPTNAYPRLPENEFAVMSFAAALGLDVPQIELRSLDTIPDAYPFLEALLPDENKFFAIKRFDRTSGGERIHAEDFNQVAAQQPDQKYENKTSSFIANAVSQLCEQKDVDEFVRRLVFGIALGNDDMHLKNWSLIYPDRINPKLAPMYDFVCTRRYVPNGTLALTVGGKRRPSAIDVDALRTFARLAEISAKRVEVVSREMVEKIRTTWPQIRSTILDERLISTFEAHFREVPIMNGNRS